MAARTLELCLLAALSCAPLACDSNADATRSLVVTIDSAGPYPIVRNSGRAPAWTATLAFTVGTDSGGPAEFGTIRSVLLDRHGSLYVVDPSYVQVSAFDSLGAFRHRLGRKGRGPGEYTNPYSVAALHDSVALLDVQNRIIQIYSPDGAWARDWRSTAATGPQVIRLYRTSPTDFWSYLDYIDVGGVRSVFIRYTSAGPVDTIPARHPPLPPYRGALCTVANRGVAVYGVPFGPTAFAVPLGEGRQAVAVNAEYRIVVLGRARGDTALVIEREVASAAIDDEDWAAELAKFQAWKQRLVQPDCLRDALERPSAKPPLTWLVTDDEGQLWVEVESSTGRHYDVFGPDGVLRATVRGLPSSGGIDPSIAAGRAAFIVPTEQGVQTVQVFRIDRP